MRAIFTILVITGALASAAQGQTKRLSLEDGHQAYDFAEFPRAIGLLSVGLDPADGVTDPLWEGGIHKLTHALMETGNDALAAVWARWAVRLSPALAVDEVNFPPPVVQLFGAARSFVTSAPSDEAHARRAWRWPAAPAEGEQGVLVIQSETMQVNSRIEGGDFLSSGAENALPAGSYTVLATAPGYLPARVTTEVLPGTTIVLTFALAPAAAGLLYVASRPWGTVFVDEERVGYTALAAHRLAVGAHRVRVEREGYTPFDTTITIQQDQTVRLGPIQLRVRTP